MWPGGSTSPQPSAAQASTQGEYPLLVKHIQGAGRLLQLGGLYDPRTAAHLESLLAEASPLLLSTSHPHIQSLRPEMVVGVCLGHYRIQRATLVSVSPLRCRFLDLPGEAPVALQSLRLLDLVPDGVRTTPPQYIQIYVARLANHRTWDPDSLTHIQNLLLNKEIFCRVEFIAGGRSFAGVQFKGIDLSEHLIRSRLGFGVDVQQQVQLIDSQAALDGSPMPPMRIAESPERTQTSLSLQKKLAKNVVAPRPLNRPEERSPASGAAAPEVTQSYKRREFDPNCVYEVRVSHVEDGPEVFAVQLKSEENMLTSFMREINQLPLRAIAWPDIGTACLGKRAGDKKVYRAVVTSTTVNKCQLFFVDYGTTEWVDQGNVFHIPNEYVAPIVFALRFCLSGLNELKHVEHLKQSFCMLVSNKVLTLKVVPSETCPILLFAELFLNDRSVKDLLKSNTTFGAFEKIALASLEGQLKIVVSFVDSCTNFFVQLSSESSKLDTVMELIEQHCMNNVSSLKFHEISLNMVCCAYYPDDQKWYRAMVINIKKNKITVVYVDYGNEQELEVEFIKPITAALLTLPAQAIHCVLKGFEYKPFSAELSSLLEELTVENELTMNVHGIFKENILLIDLMNDKTGINIAEALKQQELIGFDNMPKMSNSSFLPANAATQTIDYAEYAEYVEPSDNKQYYKKERSRDNVFSGNNSSYDQKKYKSKSSVSDRLQVQDDNPSSSYDTYKEPSPKYEYDQRKNREDMRVMTQKSHKRKDRDGTGAANAHSHAKSQNKGHSDKKRFPPSDFAKQNHRGWDGSDRGSDRHQRNTGKRYDGSRSESNRSEGSRSEGNRSEGSRRYESKYESHQEETYVPKVKTWKTLNDPAPSDAKFKDFEPGEAQDVQVSWMINPNNFYVQILSLKDDFANMMTRILDVYENVQSLQYVSVGNCVIAQFPEDNSLYRAEVIDQKGFGEYLVYFVDYGNTSLVRANRIWPMDNEFLDLPKFAMKCSLNDISPPDNKWPNDNAVDKFFNSPKYQCIFLSNDSDSYSITLLNDNDESVSEILVNENLAVKNEPVVLPKYEGEPVDVKLLMGQNFYSRICRVESMMKFYVCIDPFVNNFEDKVTGDICTNRPFQCTLHNFVEGESELLKNESEFKSLENQNVIIYVDDTCDNSLIVTLYEHDTGFKVECFTPDDGAYPSVPIICYRPIFSENFGLCYITHIESINEIYFQSNKNTEILTTMLGMLYNFYEAKGKAKNLTEIEADTLCAAKSSDGNWYRGKISQVFPKECRIHFVDYGNSETIPISDIKDLDVQFHQFYEQAILSGLGIDSKEKSIVEEITKLTQDKDLNVTLSLCEIGWVAQIDIDGVNINETITKTKSNENINQIELVENVDPIQNVKPVQNVEPIQNVKPVQNELVSVIVSHIDSPGQFWLQLTSDLEKLNELSSKLQEEVSNFEDLTECDIGKECIAKYSADEQYYRAVILDSDSDIITVRFTDYGNTDVLDNTPGNLKCTSEDWLKVQPYAMKCSVNALPTGMGEWTESATDLFTELVGTKDNPIQATIVLKDTTTYVDLLVTDVNITEKLVTAGFATHADKQADGTLPTCFASHVNSPSEFWIQLESSVNDLELVSEQLVNAQDFAPITEIEEGVICAAKFPEDNCWYRAKIIVHSADGTEVLFMDYGNASLTDELRNLPENLKNMPALSRKCALQKPSNIKSWSKEAEQKFTELAADGANIFQASFIASGDISIVDLYLDKKSINDQLISLCDSDLHDKILEVKSDALPSVHITYSNGPEDFWVQYTSSSNQLNTVMNALVDAEDFDSVNGVQEGDLCISLFLEDNMWYRSKILNVDKDDFRVVHVDYGLIVKTKSLKKIPEELIGIPALAKHCRLSPPNDTETFTEESRKKFSELSAKQSQQFYLETKDSTEEPISVNLYIQKDNKYFDLIHNIEYKPSHDMQIEQENDDSCKNVSKDICSSECNEKQDSSTSNNISGVLNTIDSNAADSEEKELLEAKNSTEILNEEINCDISSDVQCAEDSGVAETNREENSEDNVEYSTEAVSTETDADDVPRATDAATVENVSALLENTKLSDPIDSVETSDVNDLPARKEDVIDVAEPAVDEKNALDDNLEIKNTSDSVVSDASKKEQECETCDPADISKISYPEEMDMSVSDAESQNTSVLTISETSKSILQDTETADSSNVESSHEENVETDDTKDKKTVSLLNGTNQVTTAKCEAD